MPPNFATCHRGTDDGVGRRDVLSRGSLPNRLDAVHGGTDRTVGAVGGGSVSILGMREPDPFTSTVMTTKQTLELPGELTTVRLGMGTMLRWIASHTTLLPVENRDAKALAANFRNREALSRFLDYTAKARPVVELRKRPSRRTGNPWANICGSKTAPKQVPDSPSMLSLAGRIQPLPSDSRVGVVADRPIPCCSTSTGSRAPSRKPCSTSWTGTTRQQGV